MLACDVLPDPRIKASAADLAAQFAFLKAILQKLVIVNSTINAIEAALGAAKQSRKAELAAIRGALIDVNYSQAQLWGSGLHEKFNALFDTVDSGDFAPAQQARDVLDVLSGQLDVLLARWQKARKRL